MTERPLILVSNDDGYNAPGLIELANELERLGEVWIVAPEKPRSGVSRMITLHKPLRVQQFHRSKNWYWCSGTPTDCVYIALNHVLPRPPVVVVSGINLGANLGDDVTYSGTVAAGLEAIAQGYPAVASSLVVHGMADFREAAKLTVRVTEDVLKFGLPNRTLLNINVPEDYDPAQGVLVTRLGKRGYERQVDKREDPRGGHYYWIGGPPFPLNDEPGTDCRAIYDGQASVTPIGLDLNDFELATSIAEWPFARLSSAT